MTSNLQFYKYHRIWGILEAKRQRWSSGRHICSRQRVSPLEKDFSSFGLSTWGGSANIINAAQGAVRTHTWPLRRLIDSRPQPCYVWNCSTISGLHSGMAPFRPQNRGRYRIDCFTSLVPSCLTPKELSSGIHNTSRSTKRSCLGINCNKFTCTYDRYLKVQWQKQLLHL